MKLLIAIIAAVLSSSKPSVPALPPHPSSKAISNVGMTPDYELSAAADAGKAKANEQDAPLTVAVVSLPLNETSEDFQQATAAQEQQESAMVQACNATRARFGVAPCRESAALTAAAQGYANWLAYNNRVGHWGDSKARAAAAGFTGTLVGSPTHGGWRGLGEITHHGSRTIYDAFRCWEESDGHRFGMTDPLYDSCGFGYAVNRNGETVWVGLLGNSRTPHAQFISAAPAATAIPAARSAVSYTQPRACPGGVCGQVFYPQQPQQPRQYVQQPQQWQYQRPGLLGWRR